MPKGKPNKRYTPEFKIKVVETMHNEELSYREAARQFEITNHNMVAKWERIYIEEGKEGLYIERRGRKSTGRPPKLKKEVEEDLIAEVQRLRAENAYLKSNYSLPHIICPTNNESRASKAATPALAAVEVKDLSIRKSFAPCSDRNVPMTLLFILTIRRSRSA